MSRFIKKERLFALYEVIAAIDDAETCMHFFEDLCSPSELSAMEQRFQVAGLLMKNDVYTEILAKTNASTTTISRVSRVLSSGSGALAEQLEKQQNTAEGENDS